MIASLHGTLEALCGDGAVVNVNGVGFRLYMPTSTLSTLGRTGSTVHLQTQLVLREDSITLYGFASKGESELFQILLSVSGIGPKLALAMLSAMTVEQAMMAIASGSVEMLTTVPGIGKKTAQRLILELKDKIGAMPITTQAARMAEGNADVLAALSSLGYSVAEASRAISNLPEGNGLSLEEKVKLALQYFAGK